MSVIFGGDGIPEGLEIQFDGVFVLVLPVLPLEIVHMKISK